jgi:hypothetical protein
MVLGSMMCGPSETLGLHHGALRGRPKGRANLPVPVSSFQKIHRIERLTPPRGRRSRGVVRGRITSWAPQIAVRPLAICGRLAVTAEWSPGRGAVEERASRRMTDRVVNRPPDNSRATFLLYLERSFSNSPDATKISTSSPTTARSTLGVAYVDG